MSGGHFHVDSGVERLAEQRNVVLRPTGITTHEDAARRALRLERRVEAVRRFQIDPGVLRVVRAADANDASEADEAVGALGVPRARRVIDGDQVS